MSGCRGSGRGRGLPGAAGADDHVPSGEVGLAHSAGQHPAADLEDLARVGQPALAGVDAGEAADGGFDHHGAAAAQRRHVLLGGRVLPHLGVHGGGEDDRAAGGEQGVGEQVVGQSVGRLGEHVGGGRGDDDQVGVLADAHVRDLVDVVPDLGGDGVAGQGGPGGGAHEVQCGGGGDDPDIVPGLGESAQQLTGLVRGDAAADPQNDLGLVHRLSPVRIPRSDCAPLGLRVRPITHHRPDSRTAGPVDKSA